VRIVCEPVEIAVRHGESGLGDDLPARSGSTFIAGGADSVGV
jgi:hypothetical protein